MLGHIRGWPDESIRILGVSLRGMWMRLGNGVEQGDVGGLEEDDVDGCGFWEHGASKVDFHKSRVIKNAIQ